MPIFTKWYPILLTLWIHSNWGWNRNYRVKLWPKDKVTFWTALMSFCSLLWITAPQGSRFDKGIKQLLKLTKWCKPSKFYYNVVLSSLYHPMKPSSWKKHYLSTRFYNKCIDKNSIVPTWNTNLNNNTRDCDRTCCSFHGQCTRQIYF